MESGQVIIASRTLELKGNPTSLNYRARVFSEGYIPLTFVALENLNIVSLRRGDIKEQGRSFSEALSLRDQMWMCLCLAIQSCKRSRIWRPRFHLEHISAELPDHVKRNFAPGITRAIILGPNCLPGRRTS